MRAKLSSRHFSKQNERDRVAVKAAPVTFFVNEKKIEGVQYFLDPGKNCFLMYFENVFCDVGGKYLHTLNAEVPWVQGYLTMFGKTIAEPRRTYYYGSKSYKYSGRPLPATPWPFDDETKYTSKKPVSITDPPCVIGEIKECVETLLQKIIQFTSSQLDEKKDSPQFRNSTKRLRHDADISCNVIEHFPQKNFFNSVLLNRYSDGSDYMGWHSDDEVCYGINPIIASCTFGSVRDFQFRPKKVKDVNAPSQQKSDIFTIQLSSGSVLFMCGATQHHFQHQLPKRKKLQTDSTARGTSVEQCLRINLTFRRLL